MGLAHFTIKTSPGNTAVEVNGDPVDAQRVLIDSTPGGIPQVTVVHNATAEIAGEGVVHVVAEPTNTQAVQDWLATIDPGALEAECYTRIQAGQREPYRVALQVLREFAEVGNG